MSRKPALGRVQSASTHVGFPWDPRMPGCRQPSHLSPQLFLLHTHVLTVPHPSPDDYSRKLWLLSSQSSEVKLTDMWEGLSSKPVSIKSSMSSPGGGQVGDSLGGSYLLSGLRNILFSQAVKGHGI